MNEWIVDAETWIWRADTLMTALLVAKLSILRMVRRHAALTAYLAFALSRSIILTMTIRDTNRYAEIYMMSMPVLWSMSAWLIIEICEKTLSRYRGVTWLVPWFVSIAAILGVGMAFGLQAAGPLAGREPYPVLRAVMDADRVVTTILFFFLLVLAATVAYFGIRPARNALILHTGFGLMLLSHGLSVYARNVVGHELTRAASTFNLVSNAIVMLAWLWLLHPEGERESSPERQGDISVDSRRLARLLDEVNRRYLR